MWRLETPRQSSIYIESPKKLDLKIGAVLLPTSRSPHQNGAAEVTARDKSNSSLRKQQSWLCQLFCLRIQELKDNRPEQSLITFKHMAQRTSHDRRPHTTNLRTGTPSKELVLHTQLSPAQDSFPTVADDDPVILAHSPPWIETVHDV